MTIPPYPNLAKELIDVWQRQIASVVSDKEFIQAMLRAVESLKMPHATKPDTAPTSSASVAQPGHDAQLAYRLAMCERRIAALEKTLAKKSGAKGTARKPARRIQTTKR